MHAKNEEQKDSIKLDKAKAATQNAINQSVDNGIKFVGALAEMSAKSAIQKSAPISILLFNRGLFGLCLHYTIGIVNVNRVSLIFLKIFPEIK